MEQIPQPCGMVLQYLLPFFHWLISIRGHVRETAARNSRLPPWFFRRQGRRLPSHFLPRYVQRPPPELERSQARMKNSADHHCRQANFAVGYWVYVKLRPYRRTSVADKFQKLRKRFYGPYQITELVGKVAFHLASPPTAMIHPVFHCSKLMPHHGPLVTAQSLPPSSWDNNPVIEPLVILDHKWDDQDPSVLSVLVQWVGVQPEDATWENWADLQGIYHLVDKVLPEGVGDRVAATRPKRTIKRPLS